MKTIVHVNQHVIKANDKYRDNHPPISVKTYKSNEHAHTVVLKSFTGEIVGRFVYSPHKPLPCGAKVWFETECEVEVL